MKNDELQSKTIAFLRFPLIIGVVLIHSSLTSVMGNAMIPETDFPIYTIISNLFSEILARLAVPLFFFFSGFLFFYKTPFTLSTYQGKLKKRVRTILIPYLFWILSVISFFFSIRVLYPSLLSPDNIIFAADWNWKYWLNALWGSVSHDGYVNTPIAYQLWFMRDLMVMMIFSPLIYLLLKYLRQYALLILGILWVMNWWFNLPGFSIVSLFFFSTGAFFSIHQRYFIKEMKPLLFQSAILYIIIVTCNLYFINEIWCQSLHRIGIIVGCVFVISFTATFLDKGNWKINMFLAESSFFVYAFHGIPLALLIKASFKFLHPHHEWHLIILYFGSALLFLIAGVALHYLLKKYTPSFLSLISGGR